MNEDQSTYRHYFNKTGMSIINAFGRSIKNASYRNGFPNLHNATNIIVTSDYGGKHNSAEYKSLSFMFSDFDRLYDWNNKRTYIRNTLLKNRTMSYKDLSDAIRRKALLPFLRAANTIPGIILTLLIDKSIKSLFLPNDFIDFEATGYDKYSHWKKEPFEKLLRAIYLVNILLIYFSFENQNILWITDEDELAANETRINEAVEIFSDLSNQLINHKMGNFGLGTTKFDSESKDFEDLVSVPDLVAGTLTSVLTKYKKSGILPYSKLLLPPPKDITLKDREIMAWYSDNTQKLKRYTFVISENKETEDLILHDIHPISVNELRPNPRSTRPW
ncbi:hypothetical protein KA005_23035 [bacterium]|nr:hypothetical protein [bacterium]